MLLYSQIHTLAVVPYFESFKFYCSAGVTSRAGNGLRRFPLVLIVISNKTLSSTLICHRSQHRYTRNQSRCLPFFLSFLLNTDRITSLNIFLRVCIKITNFLISYSKFNNKLFPLNFIVRGFVLFPYFYYFSCFYLSPMSVDV